MAVLMLRHTQPRVAPGTCYGQTDLDVAESFERDVVAVLETLPEVDAIVSSPLTRCRKLAGKVAAHFACGVRLEHRLMEMNFGRWEGLAWNKVPRSELDAWASDFNHARPHGGESVAELKARVDAALAEIRERETSTLIVTHAGVIRAALAQGTDASHFQTQIDFGEIIRLPETQEERP